MSVSITITGGPELERISEDLLWRYPRESRKAVRSGVSEALKRTKARGIRIAASEYALPKDTKQKVADKVRIRMPNEDEIDGELKFTGAPGTPLRYFKTKPARAVPSFKGVPVRKRRPKDGVSVKVKKRGVFHTAYGPKGQKTFWFQAKNGAVLLGYRDGGKFTNRVVVSRRGKRLNQRVQAISTEGLFGASPIQAIARDDNFRMLTEYAEETMRKRINHQLERLMQRKG